MQVTPEERARGAWEPERLRAAILEFNKNGIVTIEGALDADYVDDLRRSYVAALTAKRERIGAFTADVERREPDRYGRPMFKPIGGNHDVNRWNMHLPSRRPFLDTRLVANPFALPILDEALGEDSVLTMMASDTPYPGSENQEIHQDALVARFTMNVPLVDFTDENGPLEVWPRTHRRDPDGRVDGYDYDAPPVPIPIPRVKELVAKIPSERVLARAGTIILRDQRILHRGTGNRSTEPRPMLSLLYFAPSDALPFPVASNVAARAALLAREALRRLPPGARQAEALNRANAAGRIIEFSARTDRDYRRAIPRDVWDDLSPRARRLLRHAHVEGGREGALRDQRDHEAPRSMRATVDMLRTAFTGMSAGLGGRRPPSRNA